MVQFPTEKPDPLQYVHWKIGTEVLMKLETENSISLLLKQISGDEGVYTLLAGGYFGKSATTAGSLGSLPLVDQDNKFVRWRICIWSSEVRYSLAVKLFPVFSGKIEKMPNDSPLSSYEPSGIAQRYPHSFKVKGYLVVCRNGNGPA